VVVSEQHREPRAVSPLVGSLLPHRELAALVVSEEHRGSLEQHWEPAAL
jgi:hypothetical protein